MADSSPTLVVHPYNWSYAEKPDIPESVYRFATAYMIIIGTFGAIGNSAILLAFFTAPAKVSLAFSWSGIYLLQCFPKSGLFKSARNKSYKIVCKDMVYN
jgi:hypothetical protein